MEREQQFETKNKEKWQELFKQLVETKNVFEESKADRNIWGKLYDYYCLYIKVESISPQWKFQIFKAKICNRFIGYYRFLPVKNSSKSLNWIIEK